MQEIDIFDSWHKWGWKQIIKIERWVVLVFFFSDKCCQSPNSNVNKLSYPHAPGEIHIYYYYLNDIFLENHKFHTNENNKLTVNNLFT